MEGRLQEAGPVRPRGHTDGVAVGQQSLQKDYEKEGRETGGSGRILWKHLIQLAH